MPVRGLVTDWKIPQISPTNPLFLGGLCDFSRIYFNFLLRFLADLHLPGLDIAG